MGVLWVFQGWFKDVLWDFRGALREFYGFSFKGCLKVLQGCFRSVSRNCFNIVSRVLEGCFMGEVMF